MNTYKRISYLNEDVLRHILVESGHDTATLRGGNFIKAKQMALEITNEHGFRNPREKAECIRNINMCNNIQKLYYALFNIMNVMNNPSERINKKKSYA